MGSHIYITKTVSQRNIVILTKAHRTRRSFWHIRVLSDVNQGGYVRSAVQCSLSSNQAHRGSVPSLRRLK